MQNKKVILSVRSLCKDFRRPNGSIFTVFEGINLDIYDGEFLAIVGLSGSGKSTLLRCMAGLMEPDRGTVTYKTPSDKNRQLSAFVFQNFALFPWMTIRENIALSMHRLSKKEQVERMERIIQMIDLKGFEDCYPRELSGGMCQRVSFARAIVADPMILFMDEPFSALDPLTSESLRSEITRIWLQPNRKIRASVLVTHRFEEALQFADRIIILSPNQQEPLKIIEIPLQKPRKTNSNEYKQMQELLESTFGELHLDRLTDENETNGAQNTLTSANNSMSISDEGHTDFVTKIKEKRPKPLINTNLTLVEGLMSILIRKLEPMDLYDLCEELGQSVDQVMPAVTAGELLGFLHTPGTRIVLTQEGIRFVEEHDGQKRSQIMRESLLKLQIFSNIYDLLKKAKDDGLEAQIAIDQIAMMLPFEDHDTQFQTLLRWGRYVNLIQYDSDRKKLFIPEEK